MKKLWNNINYVLVAVWTSATQVTNGLMVIPVICKYLRERKTYYE